MYVDLYKETPSIYTGAAKAASKTERRQRGTPELAGSPSSSPSSPVG